MFKTDNQDPFDILQNFVESTFGFNENKEKSVFEDIDFSDIKGKTFKSSLKKSNDRIKKSGGLSKNRSGKKIGKRTIKPLDKHFSIPQGKTRTIHGQRVNGWNGKTIKNVIVSDDQKVVINGVSKFMIERGNESIKNIGYWKGKKLQKLVLIVTNTTQNDLNIDFFNPNSPMKYFIATSQDIDDRIMVGGGNTSYSELVDFLGNNPTQVPNARFTFVCPTSQALQRQSQEPLTFINRDTRSRQVAKSKVFIVDNMQVQSNVILYDINADIKRPFYPGSMDSFTYSIHAGNTVSMCFYYDQYISIEEYFGDAYKKRKQLDKEEY